jgi:hypothetical protein
MNDIVNKESPNHLYDMVVQDKISEATMFLNDDIKISNEAKRRNVVYQSEAGDHRLTCLHQLIKRNFTMPTSSSIQLSRVINLIERMIDIGGKELVMQTDYDGESSLHEACWQYNNGVPFKIIKSLIDKGGKELVTMMDNGGCTALQILCRGQVSIEVVEYFLQIGGGKELLFMKCSCGWNPLHEVCDFGHSLELTKYFVGIGGRELVLEKDDDGRNSFFWACDCGGVLDNGDGYNIAQREILKYLIDTIGIFLIGTVDNNGELPIHTFVKTNESAEDLDLGVLHDLLHSGMHYGFENEYCIGGLFTMSTHDETSCSIFETLFGLFVESCTTPLRKVIEDVARGAPLLQAAIIAHSSNRIMAQIIHLFPWTKLTRDSTGRLPIQLAVETGLSWDQGIELLVHNTSTHPDILPIHTAARYGLKWENGMKDIVEDDLSSLEIADPTTNLYPFALAASTSEYDFTSVYELIRHRVDLLLIP